MAAILIVWVSWFALHSWLAALSVKDFIRAAAPRVFRHYRLLYNILAIVTLVVSVHFHNRQPDVVWDVPNWILLVGYGLVGSGILLMVAALMNYDLSEFCGFTEMNEFRGRPGRLTTDGLNRWMRHPLYTASLILISGYLMVSPTQNTLVAVIIAFVYILVGSELEERKLIKLYGPEYRRYRKLVRRFLPFRVGDYLTHTRE